MPGRSSQPLRKSKKLVFVRAQPLLADHEHDEGDHDGRADERDQPGPDRS
jgi:hypothetical protein